MQSLWMLFACFMFSIMGVCVKLASTLYTTAEIVVARGVIGTLVMLLLVRLQGGTLRTRLAGDHVRRGIMGVTGLWLWFYAIAKLPMATAITLNYMTPIWIAGILFISGLRRGQKKFDWGLTTAIAMSFVGVTLLLQPSVRADQWVAALVGLASGAVAALAVLQVRKLGQLGEPEYRVVFYFSLTGTVAGLAGMLINPGTLENHLAVWREHGMKGVLLLLSIGVTATIAQMAMTRAYRLGKALLTANLQYSGIIFASFWGMLIWDDVLGAIGWLGIGLILCSGIAATYYNARGSARASAASAAKPDKPGVPNPH